MEREDMESLERGAGCAPRALVRAGVGQVLLCGHCGQVHLQLGPVTLRLTIEAFGEMAALVQSAGRALQAPDTGIGAAGALAAPALH